MTLTGTLVAAGTATTNPAPNTLGTPNPFPTPFVDYHTVSSDWTTQAKAALFPKNVSDGDGQMPIQVAFVPSGGDAVTYTVTMWVYCRTAGVWVRPKDNASFNLTGYQMTTIDHPDLLPIFLQLSNISGGTVGIYFDAGMARAL